jgi:hypothetical protein
MKRISIRVLAALLTFVVGVAATALWVFNFRLQPQPQDDISLDSIISPINVADSEEYIVYSRVLSEERYINDSVGSVTIIDQTFGYPSAAEKDRFSRIEDYVRERMPELSQATFTDYLSKKLKSRPLENRFDLKIKAVLISQKEVESVFKEHSIDGWRVIFERYPNSQGLITLSAVGFNPDMTQALVHVGIGCGGLCGEGNLFLLHKENGVWKVQKKIMTWVS